ncbi:Hypothetical protein BQ3484_556 [Cedratvirus A11]|uniref:Uncharacterized protein n=1 Tax=Cedratvirus A11 TaxID=1903266 RepID=A0A1M7XV91_9VIRU|nr:Hypothetical protein BQ3484_556 [Cedratvirus A11]SHO33624.1 Hypothetical protein BQ3484_556 [Cedratvirus A11]
MGDWGYFIQEGFDPEKVILLGYGSDGFYGMNEDGDIIFYESGAGDFEEEGYTEVVNVEMRNILDSLPTTFSAAQRVSFADLIRGDVVHVEGDYSEEVGPCVILGFDQEQAICVTREGNSWEITSFPDYWRITLLDNVDVEESIGNILASVF